MFVLCQNGNLINLDHCRMVNVVSASPMHEIRAYNNDFQASTTISSYATKELAETGLKSLCGALLENKNFYSMK